MASLFICYRREDSAGYSAWLADRLRGKYGAERVFFDVHIAGGARFQYEIERAVTGCDVVLALIGRHWLVDASGRRRLDQQGDFVYLELTAALRAARVVIPVLVDGATLPAEKHLPEALRPLLQRQAMELSNVRGSEDLERIERAIDLLLAASRPPWWRRGLVASGVALLLAGAGVASWQVAGDAPERAANTVARRDPTRTDSDLKLDAEKPRGSPAGAASKHAADTDMIRTFADAALVGASNSLASAPTASAAGVASPKQVGKDRSADTTSVHGLRPVARSRTRPYNLSTLRDKLELFADGKGHYVAVAPAVADAKGALAPRVFWGDQRELGRVRVFSSTKLVAQANADGSEAASEPSAEWSIKFDDPRLKLSPAGALVRKRGVTLVRCNSKELPLSPIRDAEAERLLGTAAFVQADYYSPYALGRFRKGEFTYVDFDQRDRPRVMVGASGKLYSVEVYETTRADTLHREPSFETERGTLVSHFVEVDEGPNYRLTWVENGREQNLTMLPLVENWKFIYGELGVYGGRMPSPCDSIEPF